MPLNFLLAEDRPNDARLIQEAFRSATTPVNLHVVSDGARAVALLRQEDLHACLPRPDLILLDLSFSTIDNSETLVNIKRDVRLRTIPAFIVNASEQEADLARRYELQVSRHLNKSTQMEAFDEVLKRINDIWLINSKMSCPSDELALEFNVKLGNLVRSLVSLGGATEGSEISKGRIEAVLFIGDSAQVCPLLLGMFSQPTLEDIEFTHVRYMKDAELHLAVHPVDVILLDLGLLDAPGLASVQRARAVAPHVPVVVLGNIDNEPLAELALEEGAVDYLIKEELDSRGLRRSLRHAVERRNIEDQLCWEQEIARVARARASAKSRFLAAVSHELRTPLNGILGYAQLLHLEGGLNILQSARVDAMLSAGTHLLQMINSVLDLSEISEGHIELRNAEFELREFIGACLDFVRPVADGKQLALNLTTGPNLPQHITADPMRLRQVLLNLLANAVKFTVQGSVTLHVEVTTDRTALRFEVVDTGPGIPADQHHDLFQDFKRLDAHVTGMLEGAGLGLAIANRLTVLMGGRLGHKDNPAGGSVFWLELPLLESVTAVPLPATADVPDPPDMQHAPVLTNQLCILVVDDIAMNLDIAGSFLRAAGHLINCATSATEAIAAVTATDFDVVLMDVRMPEMDGLEATRRIRDLPGSRGQVPIVAMTAHAFTEQVEECREAGMNDHVTKPFTQETLLDAVVRAAGARQARVELKEAATEAPPQAGAVASDEATNPYVPPLPSATSVIRALDSELPILDREAFERTSSFLSPEVVARYLQTIAQRAEALLQELQEHNSATGLGRDAADAAHALAGSAGMFGFQRLAAVARRFQYTVETGAEDTSDISQSLSTNLRDVLGEIHSLTTAGGTVLS